MIRYARCIAILFDHSPVYILKIGFLLLLIIKTDYLYSQKSDPNPINIFVRSQDSIKNNQIIQRNQAIEIKGNIAGNININIPDTAVEKAKADTQLCFKKRCYEKAKFEFRGYVFADFVAIDNDRPNGLVQTNALLSFRRPTLIYKTTDKNDTIRRGENGFRSYFLRNVILIDLTLSKIGNQIRYLPARYAISPENDTTKIFNRFDLLQYANVITVSKVNIYTLQCLKTVTFYCDVISMFYNTPVSDSLASYKSNVCSIAFGGNIKAIAEYSGGFSAEIAYTVFAPSIFSNIYNDRASLQVKESPALNLDLSRVLKNTPTIQALDLRIGYESKSKKIDAYFKFSIYQNLFRPKGTEKNIFVQIQLGTFINIQKFFSGDEKEQEYYQLKN